MSAFIYPDYVCCTVPSNMYLPFLLIQFVLSYIFNRTVNNTDIKQLLFIKSM